MDHPVENVLMLDDVDFKISYSKQRNTKHSHNKFVYKTHNHNTYEIYYLLSGERYYFIKDRTFHVKKGDIVLVNAYDLHSANAVRDDDNGYERILIRVNEDFLEDICSRFPHLQLFSCFKNNRRLLEISSSNSHIIEGILFRMLDLDKEYKGKYSKYGEFHIKALLADLLVNINKYSESQTNTEFKHPTITHKIVSDILVYINENYMYNITLDTITAQFYISKYYFTRVFKQVTGMTFIDYLNTIRIREAQRLLLETPLKITEIAHTVGFESISNFGKVFKSKIGFSPLSYKRLHKK